MSTSTMYSTSREPRGLQQSAGAAGRGADTGTADWIHYVVYFLAALLVVWGVLFVLIRVGAVGPNDWLYDNTKWIPYVGEGSWARRSAAAASGGGG